MSLRIQDFNKTVSQVFAVAQGPDGKPALLPVDKPAGAVAEKFIKTAGKITAIEYYATYNPTTETGTLVATKNIRWETDGSPKDTYWTFPS